MTKLVKNLIIGGTSTVVVAGGGTAIALSLTKKKSVSNNDQAFVLKQQEDIAQAKLELEKLQTKLNAATTSEELARVEEEVKAWLEKNTSSINEIGENVEKQILEAEHQKEQEIIWAEHQKQDAEYERLQAERERQEAAFKASTNVEDKGTFTTFQLEGTINAPATYVKPAYKEGVVIATPELQVAPMLIPNLVPQIHPQKTPQLVKEVVELQAVPSLMVTGERGEVVATQEFAFKGYGKLYVPEPVTGETPILVPTVLATSDKAPFITPNPVDDQIIPMVTPKVVNDQLIPMPIPVAGEMVVPFAVPTQLATSDKAPFITPNPVDDQIIPMVVPKVVNDQLIPMPIPVAGEMVVPFAIPTQLATSDKAPFITPNPVDDQIIPMVTPKITEPQLIPQATPVKLPQVEMQVPPLYVQGIIGGFSAERQGLVATHELAFEGAQTLDQFVDSLKESTKGLKEDAKQLEFKTAQAKDVHKSAKLDAKEALHVARLVKAAELDKQFEAKQAALEQRKAVAELNSRVDHGVGTVEVKAPYGQVVAPIVYATPSLTPEGEVNAAIAFAATAAQGHNVDTLTPVRHELTDVESFALDAKLAAHIKAIEAQSQSPVGIDVQESIDRETASRALAIKADQDRIATETRLEQERIAAEEKQRIAIQAELDRLVAEQESKEAAYAAQFGSSFYSPAYNNFMTGIFTDYERLAKEYELQSVTNENQRWLGDLFATRFSTPVPRAQAMLDQLAKMTGTLDRNQAGFLGQQLVNEIYGRTDVAGIRIAVTNGNIEVRVVGPNGLNPDSVIETAKIPYTVMPTTVSAGLNPVQSIATQLATNAQDFKQVIVEQVAQQFKNMISQTVNGNSVNQFGIQNFAYDIMSRLANDIKGSDYFHLVSVEENAVEHFRTVMQNARVDRNVFIAAMQQAIQVKVRQAFAGASSTSTAAVLTKTFGSMDQFISQILSSIESMY